jgi:hypothetical protein
MLERAARWGEPETNEEQDALSGDYVRADSVQQAKWDSDNVLNVPCDFSRPRN